MMDTTSAPWRSALYPENWKPGHADESGNFLHDFSYAGYHRGERPIPEITGAVLDVTQAPFGADSSGWNDATAAIQAALDACAAGGGGIVFLPAGTYRVSLPENGGARRPEDFHGDPAGEGGAVLKIRGDRTVLRGAGAGATFLYLDTVRMRHRHLIEVKPENPVSWIGKAPGTTVSPLTEDALRPTLSLRVENASLFAPGDPVVARIDLTQRFIDELGMTGEWTPEDSGHRILAFCRRIVAVDRNANTLEIDAPTRYALRREDNARVIKLDGGMVSEVGLEDFSIGMRQHPGTGLMELDHHTEGTVGYDVNRCCAINLEAAENCWVRRVNSYCPEENDPRVHILSCGIRIFQSRCVTVEDCEWKYPQYLGGGGDGYLSNLHSQECLVKNFRAQGGRHNFTFGMMISSGNVLLDCLAQDGFLASDFHTWLALVNLIDNMTCDADYLEAKYRPWGNWGGNPLHGVTTTQSVFWNTRGLRYGAPSFIFTDGQTRLRPQVLIESKQYGRGYVIGTRGPACAVESENFVEGEGIGDSLEPRSLYADQLGRRLQKGIW